ncbi:MAG: hypothetical protein C0599_15510 [Salinivirgaceae bacterium]|nr:MAG: hypothetical protein C0599_15510 [Salinivirgaceae bacterium]
MKMLDHQKIILRNIYHNKTLFAKELKKSTQWLNETEIADLQQWINKELGDKYSKEARTFLESA